LWFYETLLAKINEAILKIEFFFGCYFYKKPNLPAEEFWFKKFANLQKVVSQDDDKCYE